MRRLLIGAVALAIAVAALQAQPEDDGDIVHTVSAGDTLISIALAYGVTLEQLLTLNELDPEALLQIGQRLLVIRAPEYAEDPEAAEAVSEDETAAENTVGGNVDSGDLPPAPVIEADAPMHDPADISAQFCYAVFRDDNQNGMMDAAEAMLPDATIRLLDEQGVEQLRYTTDGSELVCERGLERTLYLIEGAPPGFGLTSASRLRLDLRSGGMVKVEFGAKSGLETATPALLEAESGDTGGMSEKPRSLLRELSGIFALGLAAIVFVSGMALALFLRGR